MARRRVQDAQQSHQQPHPAKRGKRGRPKGQTAPMVLVTVRIPADVFDAFCRRALHSRTTMQKVVRGVLISGARGPRPSESVN